MEEYLMTARSVTQAQRMMQALSQHGIRAAMGPLTGGTYRAAAAATSCGCRGSGWRRLPPCCAA